MSERRYDRRSGQWVTVASHRQDRTFLPPAHYCPLCPTTADSAVATEIGRPDFEIVVFDNRFSSMWPDPPRPKVTATGGNRVESAHGRCEVVVYSADHNTTLAGVGASRLRLLVDVWADRYLVLAAEGYAYVMPFENKERSSGPPWSIRTARSTPSPRYPAAHCARCRQPPSTGPAPVGA